MDQLGKETDLSRERPSRRSRWPARRTTRAIGRHRRALTPLKRKGRAGQVPVTRVLDLPALEGDPTDRADVGLLRLDAEVRPLRGHVRLGFEAPVESQPGTAMTAAILLSTGAILAGCGLAAGYFWRFPPMASMVITVLLFLSPVITYMGLRWRR
jgi:hypothetical protein